MLTFEYEGLFKELYRSAEEQFPQLKESIILVNTHEGSGVTVAVGNGPQEGQYLISTVRQNEYDEQKILGAFTLGLTMVIYDVLHGEFDYKLLSDSEREEFHSIYKKIYMPQGDEYEVDFSPLKEEYHGIFKQEN